MCCTKADNAMTGMLFTGTQHLIGCSKVFFVLSSFSKDVFMNKGNVIAMDLASGLSQPKLLPWQPSNHRRILLVLHTLSSLKNLLVMHTLTSLKNLLVIPTFVSFKNNVLCKIAYATYITQQILRIWCGMDVI